jgi:hypothetical protein
MTHDKKIKYMSIVSRLVGYDIEVKHLDMFISLTEIQVEVENREKARIRHNVPITE